MALSEFDLISRFFSHRGAAREDVALGVGDDGAVLECPAGSQLVAAIDSLVEDVHFAPGSPARSIGHRALAVNLSDLAAMGAQPAWALLALALPRADATWLQDFSDGLDALARQHDVALVGGDTTGGKLCVTVQILGFVPRGSALTRSGGQAGDAVFVSGTPGDAAAGLMLEQARLSVADAAHARWLLDRFRYPTPRVSLGLALRGLASACIDVSDGLLGDCGRLAQASGCGVTLDYAAIPLSEPLRAAVGAERARELALTGGEDYELCFTVPTAKLSAFMAQCPAAEFGWSRIGTLTAQPGALVRRGTSVMQVSHRGFDHFG
ncbi:MAG TPA: thiamine-phosphate kinase [Steroidobacteraceae bacterium]|jgi:thiamine-monophosphate kinase|nr:thiamine-phosphate kinase [Steroidobacteraceae bacterium]